MAENLNEHRKGLLGKAVPISTMLVWTKVSAWKTGVKLTIKCADARYQPVDWSVRWAWMRPMLIIRKMLIIFQHL